jgi:non-ribosomal peptide synthetase component E (peptide arylation enzyme)
MVSCDIIYFATFCLARMNLRQYLNSLGLGTNKLGYKVAVPALKKLMKTKFGKIEKAGLQFL